MANEAGINKVTTVLEHCRVSPPPDPSVTEKLLPLTFLDLMWLKWYSTSRVYFYDLPCSTAEFMQTHVPQLKNSLALALEYYFPLCGNLILPTTLSNDTTPAIRYLNNDSVSLTIVEFTGATSQGFEHLSGNHARDADDLLALVPELPQGHTDTVGDISIKISPVFSIQLTLFPGQGFSFGFRNSHVVADGKAVSNFVRTWASINAKQLNGECDFDDLDTLPFYDRSVIKDPKGITSIFLKAQYETSKAPSVPAAPKKAMVRATHVMNSTQIQGLKDLVLAQVPHVSTFIVTCAYVWTCIAKAYVSSQQEKDDDNEVEEYFGFAVDVRARLDPPISTNYFGNAISFCAASLKTCLLVGDEGFLKAVEEIRKVLHEKITNKEGVLEGLEKFFDRKNKGVKGHRFFTVSGSPIFGYYSTDFGWGNPKKYELLSGGFGLNGFRDSKENFEIGLCLPKDEMDAFTTIFNQGLVN